MEQNLFTLGYLSNTFGATETSLEDPTQSPGQDEYQETEYSLDETEPSGELLETANNLAANSVDITLDKAASLLNSNEVKSLLKDYGLDVVVKNTSRDMVKNTLALMGCWYATKLIKNKYTLVTLASVAAFLYLRGPSATTNSKTLV